MTVALGACLVLLPAACDAVDRCCFRPPVSGPGLTADELAGRWESADGVTLVLRADGGFSTNAAPAGTALRPAPETRDGRWRLGDRGNAPDTSVELGFFRPPDGSDTARLVLVSARANGRPALCAFAAEIDDPCGGYLLTRATGSPSPSARPGPSGRRAS
ncbi:MULTISPECIES: hypothetical protein [Kitasatospora]|uniref:Uncharacterized protein n=1 Tax=Kitasatospora setae (strain ATCC 33774 / DSM 43861 / JCM 3304 / KCC A-0304 / NBRC 14216 / KM-6054) TaxID=452652 RepID=E4NIW1_KITSK|nr:MULTISPECIES: hypothetical protein [Kitasatospora]BAJ32909.1 hypothetical protein KSE_71530 [Kitasatospora setae KM-6054]